MLYIYVYVIYIYKSVHIAFNALIHQIIINIFQEKLWFHFPQPTISKSLGFLGPQKWPSTPRSLRSAASSGATLRPKAAPELLPRGGSYENANGRPTNWYQK